MCRHVGHRFAASDAAPRQARALVADELRQVLDRPDDDVISDALLVVSELVTNAVAAGSDGVDVKLEVHHGAVTIVVEDAAAGRPVVQPPSLDLPHGRGLYLVEQLTVSWGVREVVGAKQVWATLPVPVRSTSRISCSLA